MRINFNCWALSLCGGNRVIFELSNALVDEGHKVSLTHMGVPEDYQWFKPIKARIFDVGYSKVERLKHKLFGYPTIEEMQAKMSLHQPKSDVNIATFCLTALPTFARNGRIYLIQHDETTFFTDGRRVIAEQSYGLPMKHLCVSKWLTDKFGGVNIGNGINLQKFQNHNQPRPFDVLMIDHGIKRKGKYDLVAEALRRFGFSIQRIQRYVPEQELTEAYNHAKVFLNLSGQEGFGFQPLEAAACGCNIVSTPSTEYLTESNSEIIGYDYTSDQVVEAVAKAIINHHTKIPLDQYDFKLVVERFKEAIDNGS
jgi:hypothetical protein